ncbi:MerR family transcriptional regulator [Nocardioides sp.]|uniref:MerR family transcriptional regulator n=1 Tax=Nocardioides sp. TaxID=35761 RepID=UPI002612563E|nr:MerR family transcriptional regulator [Nocardioides sp.]
MTAAPGSALEPLGDLMTVDELATAAGLTVRNTRYYSGLGLLPPPVRRGRMAYYDRMHLAHLELVRALQEHGFTLQAIERVVSRLPEDATTEDLALQRAMMTSWTTSAPVPVDRGALERRAGRPLADDELALLVAMGALEETDEGTYLAAPNLETGLELLDLDVSAESLGAASEAIGRHMEALAEELTTILRTQVLQPYRRAARASGQSPEQAAQMEHTVSRLRQLTLEAVVTGFQRAANAVIARSLTRG